MRNKEQEEVPQFLQKFQALRQRQKPLYTKAYEFIKATTAVLKASIGDTSPTAYFASISQVINQTRGKQANAEGGPDKEVLAYCYAAVISSLDIAVIQNQHAQIWQLISSQLQDDAALLSDTALKYYLVCAQFLLHSKTQKEWALTNQEKTSETAQVTKTLLSYLTDTKHAQAQRQAIKSVCLLLKNTNISKQPLLIREMQAMIQFVLTDREVESHVVKQNVKEDSQRVLLLNFLSAAMQIMPAQICCDSATAISRLIDQTLDEKVKTTAYLSLEVLYASRRLSEFGDHIEGLIRHLLENPEMPDFENNMRQTGQANVPAHGSIIAYMQATSQIVLNMASAQGEKTAMQKKKILRYITLACNIFCEYLLVKNERVQNAGFSSMRLMLSHGLTADLFKREENKKSKGSDQVLDIVDLLKFDALSLSEEVGKMKSTGGAGMSGMSPQDRLVIHLCYLLTNRFANSHHFVLKLVKVFVERIGATLPEKQSAELLLIISQLRVNKESYEAWTDTLGTFMKVLGPQVFFSNLPLRLCSFDLNSLSYAQDSGSYLISVAQQHLKRADLAFFVQSLLPEIEELTKKCNRQVSLVKKKKYETLIIQIWELLPIFVRYNSPQLSSAFATLLQHLEPMINKNTFGLRNLALKTFTELINHCRNTAVVTEQIKLTRKGLQRICMDYVQGLSKMYVASANVMEEALLSGALTQGNFVKPDGWMGESDRTQCLKTLQSFSSIAKAGTLNNLFLTSFAELVTQKQCHSLSTTQQLLQIDILIAIMEKVKLKRDNYIALMRNVKVFIDDKQTQKKAYTMLARVVERFELSSLEELIEIKAEIVPLMKGNATKQRLQLILGFIKAVQMQVELDSDPSKLPKTLEIFRSFTIEIITAIRSTNLKMRLLAQDAFTLMGKVLSCLKQRSQIFPLMLVGLAGVTPQVQSCAVRALIFVLKESVRPHISLKQQSISNGTDDQIEIDGKLLSTEAQVQGFLQKVTKIIALLLKDSSAPNELLRSALKFIKVVVSYLDFSDGNVARESTILILQHVFGMKDSKKYTMVIRKILAKLISRVGLAQVKSATTKEHQKLISYIEREKRKRINAKERVKLMALMGREGNGEEDEIEGGVDQNASDSDEDPTQRDGSGYQQQRENEKDSDSESDSDEDASDLENGDPANPTTTGGRSSHGRDHLARAMMPYQIDIPMSRNIPVVSTLAKEQLKEDKKKQSRIDKQKDVDAEMEDDQQADNSRYGDRNAAKKNNQIDDLFEKEQNEIETHFVENPFIRLREKTSKKQMEAKQGLAAEELEAGIQTRDQDIILLKEEQKFVIKDFEQMEIDKAQKRALKRKRRDTFGYGQGEDISDSDSEEAETKDSKKSTSNSANVPESMRRKIGEQRLSGLGKAQLSQMAGQSASRLITKDASQLAPALTGAAKRREDKKAAKMGGKGGGHKVVQSGDTYKSEKGKGDVLKVGTHEPYAYFQLNPDMLNPRKKKQAVATFEGVVSHGKKTDKRSGKKGAFANSTFAGVSVKAKQS